MAGRAYDDDREARIASEVIVDAYNEEERALGWYYYLQSTAQWPFRARCAAEHATCPLLVGDVVDVSRMAPEDACMTDMVVLVRWMQRTLGVPLRLLKPIDAEDETRRALEDWRYWLDRGYQL
jgi:hypothetical protein